jgi:hypothetical protein
MACPKMAAFAASESACNYIKLSIAHEISNVKRSAVSLTCSARVPKQNDLRNFLMSDECAEMAELVANLA